MSYEISCEPRRAVVGELSELYIARTIQSKFSHTRLLTNLTFKLQEDKNRNQIDMVVLDGRCIYVIEIKSNVRYIKGNMLDNEWLITTTRTRGYFHELNIYVQNQRHLKSIRKLLQRNGVPVDKLIFKNIIIISTTGHCKVNSDCDNIFSMRQFISYLEEFNTMPPSYTPEVMALILKRAAKSLNT